MPSPARSPSRYPVPPCPPAPSLRATTCARRQSEAEARRKGAATELAVLEASCKRQEVLVDDLLRQVG